MTIRDVAREAEVSVSTVSRALNRSAPISVSVRERVAATAERLGYKPSGTARSLRRSRTMTVGVMVPDLSNSVYLQWLKGAENCLQSQDFSLLICDGQGGWQRIGSHLTRLYEHRVDGLLLAGPAPFVSLRPFFEAGIPVEPDPRMLPRGVPMRALMEEAATLDAYRSLVAAGHERIAFVGRPVDDDRKIARIYTVRLQRLHQVLEEAGLPVTPELAIHVEMADLPQAVAGLMNGVRPPTAIVAATPPLVAPVIDALSVAGLRIPQDVSFLSFGDSDWAVAYRPQLSVIRHDYYAEAHQFAERLLARIATGAPPREEPMMPSEFVPRASIAEPREQS